MSQLQLQLLGGFSVMLDGDMMLPGKRSTRVALLPVYLLLKREKWISREHLAYIFWPDSTEAQARTNLRSLLLTLRKQAPYLAAYVEEAGASLRWRTDLPQAVDVTVFGAALQAAMTSEDPAPDTLINILLQAVTAYRGELLPGHYEDWVLAERQRLHTAYMDALIWLIELLEKVGRSREAIRYAEELLRADALRETTYLLLMRLHAAHGDRARALAIYAACRSKLIAELGVEPGPAIEELHKHILTLEAATSPPKTAAHVSTALVGRAAEWSRLISSWGKADAGNAQVVLISGEAGIGKTKLVQEFLQWCEARGAVALTAYCPQAQEPLGYLALSNWLSTGKLEARLDQLGADELALLAALAPALRRRRPHIPPSPSLDDAWQRLHLYQALSALLVVNNETTVLFLDDAQWCDGQSLDWLQSIIASQAHTRLLVILSARSGGSEAQSLTSAKTEMTMRGRLTQIILPRLTWDETRSLANTLAAGDLGTDVVDRLHSASNGNPFFVVELVRMLDAAPIQVNGDRRNVVLALPESVAAIIAHQLAPLSRPARHVLDVGASIGKNFSVALLARTDQLSDETRILALDELVRLELLCPVDEHVLAFSHELIQEVVCAQLGELRRRYLRQLVTQAVADLYGDKTPA